MAFGVEARTAAKCPIAHRTAPATDNAMAPRPQEPECQAWAGS